MQASVAISYFHRKIGPIVYYSFPEAILLDDEKARLAEFMDQIYEEGFFTHKFGKLASMNYYFEINSSWARGNKEMLMVSFIIDKIPSQNVETLLKEATRNFAIKLRNQENLFKAFYSADDAQVSEEDFPEIKEFGWNIRFWLKELYWMGIEEIRERTEEEKWAAVMSKPEIFNVINKLSKGPLAREDLERWFENYFPNHDLDAILGDLEKEKFIFINSIGQESYVLLVKQVSIMRVPPDCIIDMEEDSPELGDLLELYINTVRDYFEGYGPNSEDALNLFKIFADPKMYNIITQLRDGPMPKDKVHALYSESYLKNLIQNLDHLQELDIIHDFSYAGEQLYMLKTDVVLTASFPEYLKRLLPKESKGYIAQAYSYRRIASENGDEDSPTPEGS